jgi:hypothetical protein
MSKRKQEAEDLRALKYTFAGHPFASVRSPDGISSVSGEYSSLESARRLCNDSERIYRRTANGWVRVEAPGK